MTDRWTVDDLPDLTGKTIIVTGANSGIGYEATVALARRGAHVVMACRSLNKAGRAVTSIHAIEPRALLEVRELDLASLKSVRHFARGALADLGRIDVLINNAGVMALPRKLTEDGFEMHFGVNHLGPFALTGLLLPRLVASASSRVVTVSSNAHLVGKIRFDDLKWERRYRRWNAYAMSKLANLLFAFELDRRLRDAGHDVKSVACHPGYAATNLQDVPDAFLTASLLGLGNRLMAQSAEMGALPTLFAAVGPEVEGGDFIGPGGLFGLTGYPRRVSPGRASQDAAVAARLWEVSERLTGVTYDLGPREGPA